MYISSETQKEFLGALQRESGFLPEGRTLHTARNRRALSSVFGLQEAMQTEQILEARVTLCDAAHDLHVDLGCMQGIIPRCEGALGIEEGAVRDVALISRVGKPVCFRVIGFDTEESGAARAVLSRRSVQADCAEQMVRKLARGDVIGARITHMEPFGAFADVGAGLSALLPIDSISVSRIPHPSARFTVGQEIRAVVKSVDETGRVTLTHKELLGTWEQNAADFQAGQTVPGIIRSVERYGIFVELTPNLAGLAEYVVGVQPGQCAGVFIKSILPERMKLKLILVDTFPQETALPPIRYYTDCAHMDRWIYSPDCCDKVVETVF